MRRDCQRIAALLPALPDGDLAPSDRARVEAHLASCQQEARAFLDLGKRLRQAPVPDAALPSGVEAVARILEQDKAALGAWRFALWRQARPLRRRPVLALATVAVAALLVLCIQRFMHRRGMPPSAVSWGVARLTGAPKVGTTPIGETGRLQIGQWLVTDSGSRARLQVAGIGQVEIEPNTRVRLVESRASRHQIELLRGGLHARISAPPRLFFVETPSALAVDLGCAYTLTVGDAGGSHLCVTTGWVALVSNYPRGGPTGVGWREAPGAYPRSSRETIVPAGVCCDTRRGLGPGTPYFEDAPAAFRRALATFDFEGGLPPRFGAEGGGGALWRERQRATAPGAVPRGGGTGGDAALRAVLAAATPPDSLSLWYLLSRAQPSERGPVYDCLAGLTPPPPEVTRDGVLQLDQRMLDLWRKEIEEIW